MLSDDLENWMRNLPKSLKDVPLINLAIPGSHDSMSYGINSHSAIAPDAEKDMVAVYRFLPCVVRKWARTQGVSIAQQLKAGIRYFDLRVAKRDTRGNYYFVHGLYCEAIQKPFQELRSFLDEHPEEFVVLDCQHFYNFNADDHDLLSEFLLKIFGRRLYEKRNGDLRDVTLSRALSYGKQVLVIYREYLPFPGKFWNSHDWPTPWPNTVSVSKLKEYLERTLERREQNQGFVSQVVLTPDAPYLVPRFASSLKSRCAKKVLRNMSDWIMAQRPGPFYEGQKPTCNVFIADFIDLQDNKFPKMVVDLNHKIEERMSIGRWQFKP